MTEKETAPYKDFKDPHAPEAWYWNSFGTRFHDRYERAPVFGAKQGVITKRVFKMAKDLQPDYQPFAIYEMLDSMADFFLTNEAFNWITLRDIESFAGNFYRVLEEQKNESDYQENFILDTLYRIEEELLAETPREVSSSKEIPTTRGRPTLGPGDG